MREVVLATARPAGRAEAIRRQDQPIDARLRWVLVAGGASGRTSVEAIASALNGVRYTEQVVNLLLGSAKAGGQRHEELAAAIPRRCSHPSILHPTTGSRDGGLYDIQQPSFSQSRLALPGGETGGTVGWDAGRGGDVPSTRRRRRNDQGCLESYLGLAATQFDHWAAIQRQRVRR